MILTRGLGVGGGLVARGYGAWIGGAIADVDARRYGGGRRLTDEEHRRLVEDKWNYIDRIRDEDARLAREVAARQIETAGAAALAGGEAIVVAGPRTKPIPMVAPAAGPGVVVVIDQDEITDEEIAAVLAVALM